MLCQHPTAFLRFILYFPETIFEGPGGKIVNGKDGTAVVYLDTNRTVEAAAWALADLSQEAT